MKELIKNVKAALKEAGITAWQCNNEDQPYLQLQSDTDERLLVAFAKFPRLKLEKRKKNWLVRFLPEYTNKQIVEMVRATTGRKIEEWDANYYAIELDRYRRHDHGGGEDGDDWLPDEEVAEDYEQGVSTYSHVLEAVNKVLAKVGAEPAQFELGEKGHFSINFELLAPKED